MRVDNKDMFTLHVIAALAASCIAEQQPLLEQPPSLRACSMIDFQLPGRVAFRGDSNYEDQTTSYWATNQGQLLPSCRVTPNDTNDLQQLMYLITETGVLFAIKSGGHSVVANTSNIYDGVAIDLERMNHVNVDLRTGTVDVGVGARWRDVYSKLEGTNYGVAGGRAGSVGVGGYLLGGGLSTSSGLAGWGCDQITMLEVVLANGTVLEASKTNHQILFIALKGGGNNFGVVTRARLRLIEGHKSREFAILHYELKDFQAIARAVVHYAASADLEPEAAISVSVGGSCDGSPPGVSAIMTHKQKISQSTLLAPFFAIDNHVVRLGSLSQLELATMYDEWNPKGFRQSRVTTTIANDYDTLIETGENYASYIYRQLSNVPDYQTQAGMLIQPLTIPHLHAGQSTNPNMIGLQDESSPLLLLSFEARHSRPLHDLTIEVLMNGLTDHVNRIADQNNASHSFRYLNYASANEIPFEHVKHNEALWSGVLEAKRKYDPENVFGRQMRHPFKISVDM